MIIERFINFTLLIIAHWSLEILSVVATIGLLMFAQLLALDNFLFRFIYHLPHPFFLVMIMEFFSIIGYFGFIWIALGIYVKKLKPVLLALLIVLIVVDIGMKFLVARPRPYLSALDQLLPWESFSFPSGHAAAAFACAYILIKMINVKWQMPNKNAKKKRLIIDNSSCIIYHLSFFIWLLALAVSFSRIYLGHHYPMDVVAGAIIGWGIGYFVVKLT